VAALLRHNFFLMLVGTCFHTMLSVGRKKLSVYEKNVAAFSCCDKLLYPKTPENEGQL